MKNNIAKQRKAGTLGRKRGHTYETKLSEAINAFPTPFSITDETKGYLKHGKPQEILVNKLLQYLGWKKCTFIKAYCTGGLATAECGDKTLIVEGKAINSSKSDIIVVIKNEDSARTIGVSVKQCNNIHPTNDQLFFTTATAFYELIVQNGFSLSNNALIAMKQFCGDLGYRPIDSDDCSGRIFSTERYFWEEIDQKGKVEWEALFRLTFNRPSRIWESVSSIMRASPSLGKSFPNSSIESLCWGIPDISENWLWLIDRVFLASRMLIGMLIISAKLHFFFHLAKNSNSFFV